MIAKETENGVFVAYERVSAPGYTIDVSTVDSNTVLPGGWVYISSDAELEGFIPAWVSDAPYDAGVVVKHVSKIWRSLLGGNVWEPGVTGWREETQDSIYPAWVQPLGAHDAWPKGVRVHHAGKTWASLVDNNVWEPGVANWREVVLFIPAAPSVAAWVQPTGAGDAYQTGDRVTHNGQMWESSVDNNVWEPGVYGWIVV